MHDGQVLEFTRVTKRFGAVTAVSDLSVRVEPGVVTGFLGPNGAGKTTSLRILLGQIRPTSGTATIGGVNYSELRHPARAIGAVLEEAAYRPRRTAARQLLIAAKANGIPASRVDEVLRLVGLQDDADTRIGGFSLGMRQRLSVATALLGDPGALVLDEPANGLDPEGIRWMRLLMRRLADEGRTVLVSSHVLSEIEQVADNVVVLSKGSAVYSGSIDDLADPTGGAVVVDAHDRTALTTALAQAGLRYDVLRSGLTVRGSDAATIGAVAAAAGVALTTLQQRGPSLEEVFLDLVYGRRADSPRLDEVANPVAHAPSSAPDAVAAGDQALITGAVSTAGASAVAAGAGAGTDAEPASVPDAAAEEAPDAGNAGVVADEADAEGESAADAEPHATAGAETTEAEPDEAEPDEAEPTESEQTPDPAQPHDPVQPHDDFLSALSAVRIDSSEDSEQGDDTAPAEGADDPDASEEGTDQGGTEQPGPANDDAPSGDTADSASPSEADSAGTEGSGDDDRTRMIELPPTGLWGDAADQQQADEDRPRPDVLPMATSAVSLPAPADRPTFTELITGIPSGQNADAENEPVEPSTGTEALSVFAPLVSTDDDDDSAVDDDDDPRLAAMRTSLSAAASRFFEGTAPDYPYGEARESETDDQQADDSEGRDESSDDQPGHGDDHQGDHA